MVRALLEGRKTQTRRLILRSNSTVDGHPASAEHWAALEPFDVTCVDPGPGDGQYLHARNHDPRWDGAIHRVRCRWEIGDTFWVKETWALEGRYDDRSPSDFKRKKPDYIWYKATGSKTRWGAGRLRSSLHMPRWASRISLRVTSVRAERVRDITCEDALAEGVGARGVFEDLWKKINGVGSWSDNPWVWAVGLERVKEP